MSITEIKEEAISQFAIKVEAMDDPQALQMLLDFVDSIGKDNNDTLNLPRHYNSIKAKYSSVLEKLAQ